MSRIKRDISELKKSKPFYPFDLIVYGLLAVLTALVFLLAFFPKTASPIQGFYVTFENRTVAEYSFSDGKLRINDEYLAHFSETDDGVYFYPSAENKNDYNLIVIDGANKSVHIKEATCAGRDCTTQKVSLSGGFIYCAPHNLKIIPAGLTDPVSG